MRPTRAAVYSDRRREHFSSSEPDTLRTVSYWVAGALVVVAAVFIGRMLYLHYTMTVVTSAVNEISSTTQKTALALAEKAATAQRDALARADAERQARARAERDRLAAQQAAVDKANADAAAKEAAWKSFYRPKGVCVNPDNSSHMECVNAHLKAKTEFERRWAAGERQLSARPG